VHSTTMVHADPVDADPAVPSSSEREVWLSKVRENGRALGEAPDVYKADKGIVLEAVKQNGHALTFAADSCKSDRDVVLATVTQNGQAFSFAAESCKSDREVVLAAVTQWGGAFRQAAESCKADRGIVLAAVSKDGLMIDLTADSFRSDVEIVQAAVKQNWSCLQFASDALLEDTSFAPEVRKRFLILKVRVLSGKYTFRFVPEGWEQVLSTQDVIIWTCTRLEMHRQGSEKLLSGSDVIPDGTLLKDFPGLRPLGEVTELQLMV